MTTKTPQAKIKDFLRGKKILIGILVVVVLLAGGWWVWNRQRPEIICKITNPLHCESDNDCICVENAGCFLGNKDYYGKCITKTDVCMDFCTGWGQPPVKCINNQCTNSYKIEEVTITTDKTEYEQGEMVRFTVLNNLNKEIFTSTRIYCALDLQRYEDGGWNTIKINEVEAFGAKCCACEVICEQPPCRSLSIGGELQEEWDQFIYWCEDRETKKENVPLGKYRIAFRYGEDEKTSCYYAKTIYSNEFRIKETFSQQIIEKCEEEREFIEGVRSDPDCLKGEEFRCVDGWSVVWYYDKRLVTTPEFPQTFPSRAPEELKEATVAEHSSSVCNCEKPVSYRILVNGELEETSCEEFYKFIEDYNASCNDCLLEWSFECC